MEVDPPQDAGNVASGPCSVTVQLHPLVVLNISEHWTRNKVKENSPAVVVYGALLGKQEGHHVEVIFISVLFKTCSVDNKFFRVTVR